MLPKANLALFSLISLNTFHLFLEKRTKYKKVLIYPTILDDIKIVHKQKDKQGPKPIKKYAYNSKTDMCNYCGKMTKSITKHLLMHTGTIFIWKIYFPVMW